jgi:hypothetical protein
VKPANEIHAAIVTYFTAEKRESLLFLLVGLAAIAASVVLWRTGSPYRGMAYPLVAIALIQIVVGGTVYFRMDAQVATLHRQLASDPPAYVAAELPRMEKVRKSFTVYKAIEIALLGLGLAGFFLLRDRQTLYAGSLGLILQSAMMLALDLVAERRADIYMDQIRRLPLA